MTKKQIAQAAIKGIRKHRGLADDGPVQEDDLRLGVCVATELLAAMVEQKYQSLLDEFMPEK